VFTGVRNLARSIWILVPASQKKDSEEKYCAMNLLLAFAVSTKHYLRMEEGYHFTDLHNLLVHLPDFKPGNKHNHCKNLPLEISFHLSAYISQCFKKGTIMIFNIQG
jgi:putative membrane protein